MKECVILFIILVFWSLLVFLFEIQSVVKYIMFSGFKRIWKDSWWHMLMRAAYILCPSDHLVFSIVQLWCLLVGIFVLMGSLFTDVGCWCPLILHWTHLNYSFWITLGVLVLDMCVCAYRGYRVLQVWLLDHYVSAFIVSALFLLQCLFYYSGSWWFHFHPHGIPLRSFTLSLCCDW